MKSTVWIFLLIINAFVISTTHAEVEIHDKKKALSPLPKPKSLDAKKTKVLKGNLSSVKNKGVGTEHEFDKNKLFRCWQYGELIVAENGYQAPGPAGKTLLTRGGKKLTGFDFGETFCLYMGE